MNMKSETPFDWNYVKRTIRNHYGLNRPITQDEAEREIANLKRKHSKGSLDDFDNRLYSHLSVGPNAIDLSK